MHLIVFFKKIFFSYSSNISDNDEHIKRLFVSICTILLMPAIMFFSIHNFIMGKTVEGIIVCSIWVLLIALTISLTRSKTYLYATRVFIFLLSLLLFYELYIGGGDGAALLWFYLVPSAIIFLFGLREGRWWVIVQAVGLAGFIFLKIGHDYRRDFGIRFITVYCISAVFSSTLEYLRKKYLDQLIEEKNELEKAFDEIRILKGMVPICSSCKKIRDDKGFWTQIEAYIKTNSDVEFSHGICPDCAAKLFPSVTRQRKTAAKTKHPPADSAPTDLPG